MKPDTDVTYQTVNLYSSDKCFIYLISDVPHYILGKGRYFSTCRRNNMFILWNHISANFYEDRECCLQTLPKQHAFVH